VQRTAEQAMERGLDILSNKIVKTAMKSMKEPKTGVKYPGLPFQSSAPYEAPATQHGGGLRSRIHFKHDGKLARLVGTDISEVKYPLYLEVGTKYMDARPWLRPAVEKHTGRTGEEVFTQLMP